MAGMRQNSRNEIKICPFRDISPRKGHFFGKAAYHLTESDTPLFNSSRPAARQAFGSHFFRRGDAQQAQSVLRAALADKCAQVLSDAGVYKQNDQGRAGMLRFLATLGYTKKD